MSGRNPAYQLSPRAVEDLEAIWLYTFGAWSQEQADRYHGDLVRVLEDIASGRKSGRPMAGFEGYRRELAGSHVIYFRRQGPSIAIIRILHQRMDAGKHL